MFGNIKITCFKFCGFLLGTYSSCLLLTIILLDQRFATCSMCQYFLFLYLDYSLKILCFCCTKPTISSNFLLIFMKQRSRACNYFDVSVQTNSAVQTKKDTAERDPSAVGYATLQWFTVSAHCWHQTLIQERLFQGRCTLHKNSSCLKFSPSRGWFHVWKQFENHRYVWQGKKGKVYSDRRPSPTQK